MKNVYDGTTVLDGQGRAEVVLPEWFEALNRDFRYQLTALDAPAPDLHIAGRMDGGRFTIAGGQAGQQVCWQVTGVRQDAWANAHRIPVEVAKPDPDEGRYLHPDLFPGGEPLSELLAARAWFFGRLLPERAGVLGGAQTCASPVCQQTAHAHRADPAPSAPGPRTPAERSALCGYA